MLVVSGTVRMKAEGREQAIAAAREVLRATREEPGCVTYRFGVDVEDPLLVHIYEEWKDEGALMAHFGSAHFAAFQAAVGPHLEGPGDYKKFVNVEAKPLM